MSRKKSKRCYIPLVADDEDSRSKDYYHIVAIVQNAPGHKRVHGRCFGSRKDAAEEARGLNTLAGVSAAEARTIERQWRRNLNGNGRKP